VIDSEGPAALSEARRALEREHAELETARAELEATRRRLDDVEREIAAITDRSGYRVLERARRSIDEVAPWGTRRRGFLLAVSRTAYIVATEGARGLWARMRHSNRWVTRFWARAPVAPPAPPQDTYGLWLQDHTPSQTDLESMRERSEDFAYRPLLSIVVPVADADPQLLEAAVSSVLGQVYERWELCLVDDGSTNPATRAASIRQVYVDPRIKVRFLGRREGLATASNVGLEMATGELVGFLRAQDTLKPHALFEVVKLLNEAPGTDFIYTDEDHRDEEGRLLDPWFKPGWSPDLLLSTDYLGRLTLIRRELLEDLGGFRPDHEGSHEYDLHLRLAEATESIRHLPQPLYTTHRATEAMGETDVSARASAAAKRALQSALERRAVAARVVDTPTRGRFRVRYEVTRDHRVAIIIPTKDHIDLLQRCLESLRAKTSYRNYEITVVDNGSRDPRVAEYLAGAGVHVLQWPHPFNYSSLNNFAAQRVEGDLLLLLNDDTEIVEDEWLTAMVEHAQRPEVGVVGARLLYPDGGAQHEGVLVGSNGLACHIDHRGYLGLGDMVRNMYAVTAACMMTRTEVFHQLGGLDESLPVAFNDTDYCMRAHQKGYRIIYTPYAVLRHHEGATRGRVHPIEDELTFRRRWSKDGLSVDPYYNPNLDLHRPFQLKL
jgi:GT2 family glycosyltransferase